MDVQMPVMDGLCATRIIRDRFAIDAQPHIIALTAHAMSEDVQKCIDAGMNGHLTKPLRAAQLHFALANAFKSMHCTTYRSMNENHN